MESSFFELQPWKSCFKSSQRGLAFSSCKRRGLNRKEKTRGSNWVPRGIGGQTSTERKITYRDLAGWWLKWGDVLRDGKQVMAMALDFETEFPRTSSSYLSPEQRHQFFQKLKPVVVVVNTELVKPGGGFAKGRKFERPGSSNTTRPSVHQGAGVVLDENGTILTSAYLVPDNLQTILVRREVDEAFWEAKFEAKSPQHDLAIIVPKKNVGPFAFATLDTEGSFRIGKEVLSICHVGNLSYTSVVGQLACQDHRLFRDVGDDKDIAPLRPEKLDRDLKLLQINNCHGSPSASGAPVFSSSGRVIGLSSFVLNKFNFAVHLTILERFYNSYQERKGNERGESHRK